MSELIKADRVLTGVCGGVAKYLNIDVTIVRVLTVVLSFFFFVPIIVYIALIFIMQSEDNVTTMNSGQDQARGFSSGQAQAEGVFCRSCGTKNDKKGKYCRSCGAEL